MTGVQTCALPIYLINAKNKQALNAANLKMEQAANTIKDRQKREAMRSEMRAVTSDTRMAVDDKLLRLEQIRQKFEIAQEIDANNPPVPLKGGTNNLPSVRWNFDSRTGNLK